MIRVQTLRDPLRGELPFVQIFMNDGNNQLTWDAQLISFWFGRNPAVFLDQLVNLINNLRGDNCCGSSRTRRSTGGKITTFKVGHPVFDVGIKRCMFLQCFCQNGLNFLRWLLLQKKKKPWELAPRSWWTRACRLTCFFSASVKRKELQFGTWSYPPVQRHFRFRPTTSESRSG